MNKVSHSYEADPRDTSLRRWFAWCHLRVSYFIIVIERKKMFRGVAATLYRESCRDGIL